MTDDLRTLLLDEAARLPIPPAPAEAVLAGGRRRVRRRRAALAGGVAAALIVAGATVGATASLGGNHPAQQVVLDPAAAPASSDWAVAQGSTIHLGTGAVAKVPGQVKALYYTSAGTLVRVGASPYTDAPDSDYWLARPDGSVSGLRLSLGDRVPGTDPTLPYLAYATPGADAHHWLVVLRDVRDGGTVRTIPVQGDFTWGGWAAPPVSLSGDHVYVGVDGAVLDVAWRTGRVSTTTLPTQPPEVRGGRDVVSKDAEGAMVVVDVATGRTIKTFRYDANVGFKRWPQLSTDGSHVLMLPAASCTDDRGCSYDGAKARLIDLATGARSSSIPLEYGAFGWSATGQLLIVDGRTVRSCDPDTMQCVETKVTLDGSGPIRVSGNNDES